MVLLLEGVVMLKNLHQDGECMTMVGQFARWVKSSGGKSFDHLPVFEILSGAMPGSRSSSTSGASRAGTGKLAALDHCG
ncbi:hypothetical protein ACLOJK_030552 [Asimina triloba]